MAVWMVRAGRHGEQENFALEKGVVVIRWDDIGDLSGINTRDEMQELCKKIYPEESQYTIGSYTGQLWRFRSLIHKDDIVALPLKTRSAVALGKVLGPYRYEPDNPDGAKNTRPVEWIREDVPRSDFGQDLLNSLNAYMTVCQITRNNAEERIKAMLGGSRDPNLTGTAVPMAAGDAEGTEGEGPEPLLDLERYAQDQIRARIGARFKGHELTRLVTELINTQGYQTYMSPPGPDGGVDILAGGGPMGFDRPRLCVQVKSGGTPVDVSVLRELQGVMKNFGAEQGLLASWGGFKESVYREARTLFFEIRLWDSDKLVQALLEHYNELPDDVQAELPLKRIWTLVPEE